MVFNISIFIFTFVFPNFHDHPISMVFAVSNELQKMEIMK